MSSAYTSARHARAAACRNNLKQVGIALTQVLAEPPTRREFRELLPYLEQFSQAEFGDIPASTVVHAFRCPAEEAGDLIAPDSKARTSYAGVAGDGTLPGFYSPDRLFTIRDVRDGSGLTFAIGEQDSRPIDPAGAWNDTPTALCKNPPNSRDNQGNSRTIDFGSRHLGVTNFLMLDGRVVSISDDFKLGPRDRIGESDKEIDFRLYRAFATVAGAESVPEW